MFYFIYNGYLEKIVGIYFSREKAVEEYQKAKEKNLNLILFKQDERGIDMVNI